MGTPKIRSEAVQLIVQAVMLIACIGCCAFAFRLSTLKPYPCDGGEEECREISLVNDENRRITITAMVGFGMVGIMTALFLRHLKTEAARGQ